MKLLSRIFDRIAFVRAEFAPDGSCGMQVWLWQAGRFAEADWAAVKGSLTAVMVCGHGVVIKPDEAEITARVKAGEETFLWSSAGGQTSFVRRDRLHGLTTELTARRIAPVRIFCADTAADPGAVAAVYATQLREGLRWRWLLRPTEESSAAAQVLVGRIKLPVLGLFLSLLAANAVLAPRLNARRQALQTELAAREQTASTAASVGARQREVLNRFAAAPAVPRAVVCDRIASAVPERVVLTALEIEPLTKRFETGKPLERREGTAVIAGTAPAAADISEFVGRLSAEVFSREVRLLGVEKQREGDLLSFQLELPL